MKMRVSVNERAELVRRDGTVVGALAGITVDLDLDALGVGGEVDVSQREELQPPTPSDGDQTAFLPNPLTQVWGHYRATVAGADRRKLDSTRTSCIRRALKVRSVEECCKAIDALAASDWHNGHNPNHIKYLDIQYALGQKAESPDERIDKMNGRSSTQPHDPTTVQSLIARLPSEVRPMVHSWVADVVAWLRSPDHRGLAATGEGRLRELREKAHMAPVIEDGRIVRWEAVS